MTYIKSNNPHLTGGEQETFEGAKPEVFAASTPTCQRFCSAWGVEYRDFPWVDVGLPGMAGRCIILNGIDIIFKVWLYAF